MEMKMTNDELAKATEGILEAGRNGTLTAGSFRGAHEPQGCALGQAARANGALHFSRADWAHDHFVYVDRIALYHANDDMIKAGVPLEIVAETMAALITEAS